MRFVEIDVFGVYIAPMALMLLVAWLILVPLRRLASRFGVERHVWHPALFEFAVFMIVLSSIVLLVASRGR
jgi:protein AaeX